MEKQHEKLKELQRRIDDAVGRVGFDTELAQEIIVYAKQRRSMRPSWEEIAKELRTPIWLLMDCVRRNAPAKTKKRRRRRWKEVKTVVVKIVHEVPRTCSCRAGRNWTQRAAKERSLP